MEYKTATRAMRMPWLLDASSPSCRAAATTCGGSHTSGWTRAWPAHGVGQGFHLGPVVTWVFLNRQQNVKKPAGVKH